MPRGVKTSKLVQHTCNKCKGLLPEALAEASVFCRQCKRWTKPTKGGLSK